MNRLARLAPLLLAAAALSLAPPSAAQPSSSPVLSPAQRAEYAAERRVALVIGNSSYADGRLANPGNDARLMERTLKEVGFQVTTLVDADQRAMKTAVRDFGQTLSSGGVGLFYFAGHGIQVQGNNYLIPIGARINVEADVDIEGVRVDQVLAAMEGARNRLNILILDACRNNPFARSVRSGARGLAYVAAPTGTLIASATAPGSVAQDGSGQNGTYTEALARHLRTPGASETDVLMAVRSDVRSATNGQQVPWDSSSLVGHFYFVLPPDCGPGTVLRDGRCVSELVCPSDTELREGKCVGKMACPSGTELKDGRCVGVASCPESLKWDADKQRCVAASVEPAAALPVPKPAPPATISAPAAPKPPTVEPETRGSWKTPVLWTGGAIAGVGAIAGITALALKGSFTDKCDGSSCYPDAHDSWSTGKTIANISTGALIIGGLTFGVGLLLPGAREKTTGAAAPTGGLSFGLGSVMASGTF